MDSPALGAAAATSPSRAYRLTKLSSVRLREPRWLMRGRIPYASLTIVGGRPGEGKSQFTLALGAEQTRQGSDVLLIGAEDGLAETVRARLLAVDADQDRFHALDITMDGETDATIVPDDVPLIERAVLDSGASLVIIDPIASHISSEINSHNDGQLRQAYSPLARMARRTGAAVICVAHLRKSRDGGPLDWLGGGGAGGGAARSVLLLGKSNKDHPLDQATFRYLIHAKCNMARPAPTMRCKVEDITVQEDGVWVETSRIVLDEDDVDVSAKELA